MIGDIPLASNLPVADNQAIWTKTWGNWFTQVFNIVESVTQAGPTSKRPSRNLWTGRTYFDEDLGKPIWYNGTIWVKADGTAA